MMELNQLLCMGAYHSIVLKEESARNNGNLIYSISWTIVRKLANLNYVKKEINSVYLERENKA